MQMLQGFAPVMIALLLALPAFAQSAPEGFRDLRWGATEEQVSPAFPSTSCDARQSGAYDWMCVLDDEKVNDVSVRIIWTG